MSESHGANTTSKGILNPSSGRLRPKVSNASRQARPNSSTDRTRTPSPSPPKLDTTSATTGLGAASSSLLAPPTISFTSATPEATPISPKRVHHRSTPTQPSPALREPTRPAAIQKSHSSGSTKRKADEADVDSVTPPREHKTTFAPEPRSKLRITAYSSGCISDRIPSLVPLHAAHRASTLSGSSHAPSSYHRSKRIRTSLATSESHTPAGKSTLTPIGGSPDAKSTGSWSSRNSKASASHAVPHRASRPPSSSTKDVHAGGATPRRSASRRSLSQASIPISAFMSPHAPSVTRSTSTYHMRDPRKPARIQDTPWSLSFPDEVSEGGSRLSLKGWTERGGSPVHSWLFFIGFVIFPLWWIAGFVVPIPRTRRLDSGDAEKGVILDDPQVEHGTRTNIEFRTYLIVIPVN